MIISRTPFRISFAGGGTDLAAYYRHEPGAVLSTAIDKYMYVTVNKYFEDKIILKYSRTEKVSNVRDVKHPLLKEAMKMTGVKRGIEITSMADIVGGTGLGSSSSFTVGALHALYAYKGLYVKASRLASEACDIEIRRVKEPIGKQDQYIAAYGGFQFIEFMPDESVRVTPVVCPPKKLKNLNNNLLLFYTGKTRKASKILKGMQSKMGSKKGDMRELRALADEARKLLQEGRVADFGELLHEGWLLKRSLHSGISSSDIDKVYARARKAGAEGGKILGAGGGGFLLLYAKRNRQAQVRKAMRGWREVSIGFEPEGSRIIQLAR
ncbi:MAG: GHMP kinase [Gammaproteobacteria bacterium]|nr:GHMP kinase [Gammaproteobacteria bacterium]MDP6617233.1 GHMP kinase [Gammaproteobacteria bacterium]MDP6695820.1 GHMP kinase [Gammaproteobacteria bacterium]